MTATTYRMSVNGEPTMKARSVPGALFVLFMVAIGPWLLLGGVAWRRRNWPLGLIAAVPDGANTCVGAVLG